MPYIQPYCRKPLLWLFILLSMLPTLNAYAGYQSERRTVVYKATGKFDQVYDHTDLETGKNIYIDDPNKPCYSNGSGLLFAATGEYIQNITYGDHCGFDEMDLATLNAISGKPLEDLASWIARKMDLEKCFKRSTETYTIDKVPYVIVSVPNGSCDAGGTGGGGSVSVILAKPTITIIADQPNAAEGGVVPGRISIALDAARDKDIKVLFTISGTAKKGKDYQSFVTNVVIPAGNISAFVNIIPIDDLKKEKTEKVTLTLKSNKAYKRGKVKAATVTITDND